MLESKIQAKLIKSLEAKGYYVIKLSVTNKPGIPDILAIPPGSNVEFYEVKQPGKKPRPLQEYRIKEINDNGFGTAKIYDGSVHNGYGRETDSNREKE
jgi:Holliday junction resolvase